MHTPDTPETELPAHSGFPFAPDCKLKASSRNVIVAFAIRGRDTPLVLP